MDDRSTWRTVLSILSVIILGGRLLYTCSNMNKPRYENDPVMESFRNSQEAMKENFRQHQEMQRKMSNAILYSNYESLDSLSALQKDNYGIQKLAKDSLIYIALDTQIKIPKDFYLQNKHDDSLRMAFKSPDNLNVFIHDFESKAEIEPSFKTLKNSANLQKFKVENTIGDVKAISYKITKESKRYNGYALCFKNDGYLNFYEFESSKLPLDKLKGRAIEFFSQNMKEKK
ncbi:hypothetical protein [Flavobacterium panici]|uniref:Uncharacterized protein n=1 Tax=Flavobacterium panici TaxID=2654843 RepID=A0A9N8P431_9FLAO|nr:hypothetical protein [Flavobacterium panici]CAC9976699.1 hypothetical protein FLAPXU55_04427 [Flavobacterium panici]